jgi:hypothetical protein
VARRESDEGVCFVYVFGVHGEIVYLTADNMQGLSDRFQRKAVPVLRNGEESSFYAEE